MFNCPDELAAALKETGFHVLTTANNHCMDRGFAGLVRTLDVLDSCGLSHTGTYRTEAEAAEDLIVPVKGLRVGIAASTYATTPPPGIDDPVGRSTLTARCRRASLDSAAKRISS
jgi:poly-gamma-glutamate synthesis protein (capsule biosynthesis protein)